MRVIWAPRATQRAAEVAEYIAADSPAAAREWVRHLFAKTASLGRYPRRGRKAPEVGRDDVRQVVHGPYRIVYRIDARQVVVLTVRHARRSWDPEEVEPR
jgi:toxin ParE1/3/4